MQFVPKPRHNGTPVIPVLWNRRWLAKPKLAFGCTTRCKELSNLPKYPRALSRLSSTHFSGRRIGTLLRGAQETMSKKRFLGYCVNVAFAALGITACSKAPAPASPSRIDASSMRRIGVIDERFQSYNVEMVEVIGGRFWKPYKDIEAVLKAQSSFTQSNKDAAAVPAGMDPNLYQQRPPIDLTNTRLRKLAAALGPAYVRVSGTWANTAYFHNS